LVGMADIWSPAIGSSIGSETRSKGTAASIVRGLAPDIERHREGYTDVLLVFLTPCSGERRSKSMEGRDFFTRPGLPGMPARTGTNC
jgi:hypothetical protein